MRRAWRAKYELARNAFARRPKSERDAKLVSLATLLVGILDQTSDTKITATHVRRLFLHVARTRLISTLSSPFYFWLDDCSAMPPHVRRAFCLMVI
jgi:hypothetical protein